MRSEKQLLLDEVKEKMEQSNGFIIAGYQMFTAPKAREFRDTMAEVGGEFEVVKKRVFIKAAEALGLQFELQALQGHIGIIFVQDDSTQVAKRAVKYGEDNNDVIAVLGGQIEGEKCTSEEVIALAKLPGIQELRAQFVGLLEAPMGQTVAVLQAALTGVLYCMDQKNEKS